MASETYQSDDDATGNVGAPSGTAGGGGSGGIGRTGRPFSQVRGVAFQLHPGNPPGLGTQATPMFFCTMPSPKTTVTSPYKNFSKSTPRTRKRSGTRWLTRVVIVCSSAIPSQTARQLLTFFKIKQSYTAGCTLCVSPLLSHSQMLS